MAKKKVSRPKRRQPLTPGAFRDAYLEACTDPEEDWTPDPKRLFATYPASRADQLPLSAEDRELLVEVGLPFQFSMNGMYGSIKVADAKDRLLLPLAELCGEEYNAADFTNLVMLAEVGGVEEKSPDSLCLDTDTGMVWHFNWWDGTWTFVNSSLMQYARFLHLLRIASTTLTKTAEDSLWNSDNDEIDQRLLQKTQNQFLDQLQKIDPNAMDPSAMWPQILEKNLAWWSDEDVPLFGARPEPAPEVDDRDLDELLPELIDSSDDYYTGPKLTAKMIKSAEKKLGYKLPESYLKLLRIQNGVSLTRRCFPTEKGTSWSRDHVKLRGIHGVGGERGIDGERESQFMIREWGYPDVGIVIGDTPSGGHTTVMLDYSECGPKGEPKVIWVSAAETEDEDNWVLVLAPDFESFLRGLRDCDEF